MPEVYTGKVLIPGDQIDAYLAAMQAGEEARAQFRTLLEGLNGGARHFFALGTPRAS